MGWALLKQDKGKMSRYSAMPETDGGADFTLVSFDKRGKPSCVHHGAMSKVSEIFWRCITTAGPKFNPCRAGCQESEDPETKRGVIDG